MSHEGVHPGGAPLSRRAVIGLLAAAAGAVGAAPSRPASAVLTRAIPSTGEPVPVVGLGTWRTFDVGATAAEREPLREVLRAFVALGGRVVDSSPMYGAAESVVGDLGAELGVLPSLFVATKVWTRGRQEGIGQMERSLQRLRSSPLDLMQVHNLLDWRTHLRTLREWKAAGRIRYLGVTHHMAGAHAQLERVMRDEPLDFVQLNYSLVEPEAEQRLLPLARDRGVAVLVNRPYAEGAMFRRARGQPLPPWAAEVGAASWGQLFLRWILAHPAVTCVIPATSQPRHLADNMAAGSAPAPDAAARARIAAHFARL